MRHAALLLPLVLASCSERTELTARFVDGRLAFASLHGKDVDCVTSLAVIDIATREVMWEIGAEARGVCQGSLPMHYGRATPDEPQRAKRLRTGVRYEVTGGARDGNSLDGRFVLTRANAWRVEDVPWQMGDDNVADLDAIETNSQ